MQITGTNKLLKIKKVDLFGTSNRFRQTCTPDNTFSGDIITTLNAKNPPDIFDLVLHKNKDGTLHTAKLKLLNYDNITKYNYDKYKIHNKLKVTV